MSTTKTIQTLFLDLLKDGGIHTIDELTSKAIAKNIIGDDRKGLVRSAVAFLKKKNSDIAIVGRGRYRLEPSEAAETAGDAETTAETTAAAETADDVETTAETAAAAETADDAETIAETTAAAETAGDIDDAEADDRVEEQAGADMKTEPDPCERSDAKASSSRIQETKDAIAVLRDQLSWYWTPAWMHLPIEDLEQVRENYDDMVQIAQEILKLRDEA